MHSKYISLCVLSFVYCLARRRKGAIRTALRLIVALTISTFACKTAQAASPVVSFQQNQDGVTFTLQTGVLQLDVNNGTVRVRYSVLSPLPAKSSLIVTGNWPAQTSFTVTNSSGAVTLTTSSLNVIVDKSTSAITFQDLQGNTLLAEDPNSNRSMTPATVFPLPRPFMASATFRTEQLTAKDRTRHWTSGISGEPGLRSGCRCCSRRGVTACCGTPMPSPRFSEETGVTLRLPSSDFKSKPAT